MNIEWAPLVDVVIVSLGSTLVVVFLVAVALVGLSARSGLSIPDPEHRRPVTAPRPELSPLAGTVLYAVCVAATVAIVLYGVWVAVAK